MSPQPPQARNHTQTHLHAHTHTQLRFSSRRREPNTDRLILVRLYELSSYALKGRVAVGTDKENNWNTVCVTTVIDAGRCGTTAPSLPRANCTCTSLLLTTVGEFPLQIVPLHIICCMLRSEHCTNCSCPHCSMLRTLHYSSMRCTAMHHSMPIDPLTHSQPVLTKVVCCAALCVLRHTLVETLSHLALCYNSLVMCFNRMLCYMLRVSLICNSWHRPTLYHRHLTCPTHTDRPNGDFPPAVGTARMRDSGAGGGGAPPRTSPADGPAYPLPAFAFHNRPP